MVSEKEIAVAVGKADACEVYKYVFSFPDEAFVAALRDGTIVADLESSLVESGCGIREGRLKRQAEGTLQELRVAYTRLYLDPKGPLVYPYESAFRHVEAHCEGIPVLFRTSITLDVESQMREANVMPKNARKEPCDSIYQEFEFLSYLYGSLASAIQKEDHGSKEIWTTRIGRFLESHALRWIPMFMERTLAISDGVYGSFSLSALDFLAVLKSDATHDRGAAR